MNASLFGSLMTYRPRPNVTPEENFFTEAFAAVLRRHPRHCHAVFSSLAGHCRPPITIATQVFIESKISASQGDQQLARYWKVLTETEKSGTLAFITKVPEAAAEMANKSPFNFVNYRWNFIYGILKGVNQSTHYETVDPLVDEFLDFMEELNMASDIALGDLTAAVAFARSHSKFRQLLSEAWARSGLDSVTKGGTTGNWSYVASGLVETDICSWTPNIGGGQIRLVYGFHPDTTKPGPLRLDSANKQLPVAFIGIYSNSDASKSEAVIHAHREFLAGKSGWVLAGGDHFNFPWIARKQIDIERANLQEFGDHLIELLSQGLRELKGAPFL
jgi:hypothetical protein